MSHAIMLPISHVSKYMSFSFFVFITDVTYQKVSFFFLHTNNDLYLKAKKPVQAMICTYGQKARVLVFYKQWSQCVWNTSWSSLNVLPGSILPGIFNASLLLGWFSFSKSQEVVRLEYSLFCITSPSVKTYALHAFSPTNI